jgi:hypothetical protein
MRVHNTYSAMLAPFILLASAPLGALAGDVLKTDGYSSCQENSDITVDRLNIEFDRNTKKVKFDVAGSSQKEQKVMATLIVNAYGKEVYRNEFNPCSDDTKMDKLCPGMFDVLSKFAICLPNMNQSPPVAFPPKVNRASLKIIFRKSLLSLSTSPILTHKLPCS